MTGESALGDMKDRVKTDIRFPRDMAEQMDMLAAQLQMPRNVLYTLATGTFLADMARLKADRKSARDLLKFIRKRFEEIADRTEKLL